MAFLDNSGDIILDAVLTDTGRYRLAKADGSFRIAKFALGDDEINYGLYDKNNTSGSAYYDLSLLQTPILEAFTNNSVSLKSKLITVSRNDLLFMPIIKLSQENQANKTSNLSNCNGLFLVSVDQNTREKMSELSISQGHIQGVGQSSTTGQDATFIRTDQGLDTNEISPSSPGGISVDLKETQYIIELDNRLGTIASKNNTRASLSYLDDDQVASYFFSEGTDQVFISTNTNTDTILQAIRGPRGTILEFKINASLDLQTSTFLFEQLGSDITLTVDSNSGDFRYIDSTVRVIGATTGYRIDIPVRFLKLK
jgi:hypothetical protein